MNKIEKIILILILTILSLYKIERYKYKIDCKKRKDVPSIIRLPVLYELLEIVSKISVISNTKPFLLYGTLLGYARDKKIICYDFDLDYGIMETDYKLFKNNINTILKNYPGYRFYTKEFLNYKKIVIEHIETSLNADIFNFNIKNNSLQRNVPKWYSLFVLKECSGKYPIDLFLPLKIDTMNGNIVYIPNNYDTLLKCYYGNAYMEPDNICDIECNKCVKINK